MTKKTICAHVYGKVQGVCFRDYTKRKAEELQVNGWVRNRRDGSVEVLISGAEESVKAMHAWLSTGSPYAEVERIEIVEKEPDHSLHEFCITC